MFASISKSAKGLCKLRVKSHILKGLFQPRGRWLNVCWIECVNPMMGVYIVFHTQYLLTLHIAAEIYSIPSLLVTSAHSIIQMARHQFLTVCPYSVLYNSPCGFYGVWSGTWIVFFSEFFCFPVSHYPTNCVRIIAPLDVVLVWQTSRIATVIVNHWLGTWLENYFSSGTSPAVHPM